MWATLLYIINVNSKNFLLYLQTLQLAITNVILGLFGQQNLGNLRKGECKHCLRCLAHYRHAMLAHKLSSGHVQGCI